MTQRVRVIILALFATAFVLTTPVVILTTAGYRYNWSKDRLDKTGIIKFVTKPSGARIWLNGRLQPRTTPISAFRLLPEDYEIRMEMAGYHEWKKILEVKSGVTTFTEDVVLIRRASPRPIKNIQWTSGVWSRDGLRLAIVRSGVGASELAVITPNGKDEVLLARLTPQRYSQIDLSWSQDNRQLIFQGKLTNRPGEQEVVIYPLPPMETEVTILTRVTNSGEASSVRWSEDGQSVTFIANRVVNLTNVTENSTRSIPGTVGADDAYFADGRLFVTKSNSEEQPQILEISPDGDRAPQSLVDLPPGQWHFSLSDGNYLLLNNQQKTQAVVYRLSDNSLFGPWTGSNGQWEHADGGGRLLLWNDFEISVWNPDTNERSVVTRLSSPIGQCLWDPTGRNVIFTAGNSILAAEIDDRDGRNIYELNRMTEIGPISIDPTQRQIRFLGTAGHQKALFQQGF